MFTELCIGYQTSTDSHMYCHMPICYISGYIKTINTRIDHSNQRESRDGLRRCITGRGAEWEGSKIYRWRSYYIFILNFSESQSCSEQLSRISC